MSSRLATCSASAVTSASSMTLGHEHERAVGAGAELVGHEVVGLAVREVGRLRRGVLRPGAHRQGRGRQGQHQRRGEQRPGQRAPAHAGRPPLHQRAALRSALLANAARQHAATEQAAQGGHEGQGRGGHSHDGDRSGEAEGVVRRQPGQLQAEQGDQHDRGGEDHRAPGRGHGTTRRLDLVLAAAEKLGEAGDQQQRVVDADAETDHRGHHRGRRAHVHGGGEQGDPGGADRQAGDGYDDRESGADHGAESQHQDQQRCDDADQLAAPAHRSGCGVGQLAAELDLDPGVTGRSDGPFQRREVLHQVGVGHRHVVPHGEQGGVPVLAEPRRGHRDGVIHLPESLGERTGHVGTDGGAVGGVHDDAGAGVAGTRGVLTQLVDADLGPRAGDVPVVLGRAADAAGEGEDTDRDQHPGEDRPPGVGCGRATETVEEE